MGASCSQLPGSPLGMLKAWAFSFPQHLAGALETLTPTNLCTLSLTSARRPHTPVLAEPPGLQRNTSRPRLGA